MEMSMNQLVELTGKTFRTVKKRLKPLNPVREDGRSQYFDTVEALKLLYPTVATELALENLLLERARREKTEIEVGQLRGKLIPIEEIAKSLNKEYAILRSQFRSIPAKLAKPLSMVTDPNEIHTRLTEAVNECLSELMADAKYQLEQDKAVTTPVDDTADAPNGTPTESDSDPS